MDTRNIEHWQQLVDDLKAEKEGYVMLDAQLSDSLRENAKLSAQVKGLELELELQLSNNKQERELWKSENAALKEQLAVAQANEAQLSRMAGDTLKDFFLAVTGRKTF